MECTLYIVYNIYIYINFQHIRSQSFQFIRCFRVQLYSCSYRQLQLALTQETQYRYSSRERQLDSQIEIAVVSCSRSSTHTHIVDRYIQQIVERERQRHRYSTSSTIKRRCIYSFVSFLLFLLFQSFLVGRLNSREIRIRNTNVKTKRQLHLQLRLHSYTQH